MSKIIHTPGKYIPLCEIADDNEDGMPCLRFKKANENIYEEIPIDEFYAFLFKEVFAVR